jgi:hypothetical protein
MANPQLAREIAAIAQEVADQAGPESARWLESALEQTRCFEPARFAGAHAALARRLRAADTSLVERARGALVRVALDALPESEHVALVRELYRRGDSEERRAVLRSLPLLPAAERFASIAIDACRSNVQIVFEAIACENPYAATYFHPEAFQQLVLKALFTAVPLARIEGLEPRRTPELARMAADYASELRAAGRAVSRDVEQLARGPGSGAAAARTEAR